MTALEWQDPPASSRGRLGSRILDEHVAQLQAHPGRWALVRRGVAPGTADAYKARGCEVTSRTVQTPGEGEKRRVDLWARWPEPW